MMADADGNSLYWRTHSPVGWLSPRAGAQSLHLPNKSGECLQWLCHDDSTINITTVLLLLLI